MKIQTTAINRRRLDEKFIRAAALCLLALTAVLWQAQEARAQWSAPDAQGNVSNTNTGNVGVGTTTPTGKLDVTTTGTANSGGLDFVVKDSVTANSNPIVFSHKVGTTNGSLSRIGFNMYSTSGGFAVVNPAAGGWAIQSDTRNGISAPSLQFSSFTTAPIKADVLTLTQGGNVGIGTVNPSSKLHIFSGTDASTSMLHLDTGVHGGTAFSVAGTANNESAFNIAVYRAGQYFNRIGVTNYGHVYLVPDTAAYGNVGIGTTNPTSKLHVVGDVTVTGNINAKYQDVAEWVPSAQKLAAGTVVILDVSRDNHVTASMKSYDTRVAGVISAQPGLTLGEAGEGKALVATTGRVKVKVDATRGAIHVGDLLVTSDTPGVAMLSKPLDLGGVPIHRPGTLIGKALESLEKGTGEILVLLSLQ